MRLLGITSALVALGCVTTGAAAQNGSSRRVSADVGYLAADAREGRGVGTAGLDAAAEYLAREFARIGLSQPWGQGFFQPFTIDSTAPAAAHSNIGGAAVKNVVGVLPGRGPLAGQVVVLGAHYDHLGRGGAGTGSLDPDSVDVIHNGADDNASGTAALLEAARLLRGRLQGDRRTVVFVAFTAEEVGLIGSGWYVKHPLHPTDSTVAMINFDMVGRLRERRLLVLGAETAPEFPPLLDSINTKHGFDLKASGDGWGRSDHASFYAEQIPVIHFFTDLHEQYHRVSDDPDLINAAGIAKVAAYAVDLTVALATRPGRPTYVSIPRPVIASGNRASLGTIPDMASSPGGVRLSGVREGTPAAVAGIRAGDIIIRIGEHAIKDLNDMQNALTSYKPGDVVTVVVRRGEEEQSFTVTLGGRQ
jgi:acetylornithine deacetylase/succinyl-diaminopimelate desuccinylase-like protein